MTSEEKIARYEMALEVISSLAKPFDSCREFNECQNIAKRALRSKGTETFEERVRSPL